MAFCNMERCFTSKLNFVSRVRLRKPTEINILINCGARALLYPFFFGRNKKADFTVELIFKKGIFYHYNIKKSTLLKILNLYIIFPKYRFLSVNKPFRYQEHNTVCIKHCLLLQTTEQCGNKCEQRQTHIPL